MKRILFLTLPFLAVLLILSGCRSFRQKAAPTEMREISHFFFTKSGGSDFDMRTSYELNYADGYYTAVIKPSGVKEKKARPVSVDADFVDRLGAILKEFEVEDWNGFHEMDYDIMDGIGFTLDVAFTDGRIIDAVGYMEWPEHYGDVAGAFYDLFMDAFNKYR